MSDPLIVAIIGDSFFDELESSYYIDSDLGIQCWNTSTEAYDTLDPGLETCYNTMGGPVSGGNHQPTAFTYLAEELALRLEKDAYVFDVDTQSGDFPYLYTELLNDNSDLYNDNIGLLTVNAALWGAGLWAHNTTIEDMARLDDGNYTEEQVAAFFEFIGFLGDIFGFTVGAPGEPLASLEEKVMTYQDVLTKADMVSVSIFSNDMNQVELFEFDAWLSGSCPNGFCMEGQVESVLWRRNDRDNGDSPGCDFTENETTDDNENTTTQKIVSNCNGVFKTIAEKLDTVLQIFNQDPSNTQLPIIFLLNLAATTVVINGEPIDPFVYPTETGVDGISLSTNIMYWAPSSNEAAPELMRTEKFWIKGYADLLNICFLGVDYSLDEHTYFVVEGDGSPADMRAALCPGINSYDNLIIFDLYNQFGRIAEQFLNDLDNDSASFHEDVMAWDEGHPSTEFVKYMAETELVPNLIEIYADNVSESSPLLTSDTFDIHFNKKVYEAIAGSCGPDSDTGEPMYSDCNDVCGGDALMDNCGVCDNVNANDCTQDCNGDWGGSDLVDDCGVCDDNPANNCHSPALCMGDVNEDTAINVLDVINLVNKVLAVEPASDISDLNSNGILDVTDVALLVNLALDTTFTCPQQCEDNFTADCSSPAQCVANEFLHNTTCDSDNPAYSFDFGCDENNCENFECGAPKDNTCAQPTSCAELGALLQLDLEPYEADDGQSACVLVVQPPGEECSIYSWDESRNNVENFKFIEEMTLGCNNKCAFSRRIGDFVCDDASSNSTTGDLDLDCPELGCDQGDCGQTINDGADCFPISDCNELESYLNTHQGGNVSLPLEYEYNSQTICAEKTVHLNIGDDCQAWTLNNAEEVHFNTVVDCNNQCVPSIWKDNGTCSDGIETTAKFDCVEHGCDGFDCSTYPSNDTCVTATSCEHLATYFNLNLTKIGGDGSISCGVIDTAEPKGSTGCEIYAWDNSYSEVEDFLYTGDTIVDCNHTCVFPVWQGNGNCNEADTDIDGNDTGSNFNCPELSCDGGDCGLQISDGGECIVPTGCADLAYLMGVDAGNIQVVGAYGCSVIGDPNFSVIGGPGCLLYSWNEALDNVDNFIYTGETVVDCNSTCTYSIWEGDDSCDDVDMAYGSHLDCVEFDCDGGDCGQVINDGADCFPISDCNELESYLNLHQGETVSLLEYEYNSQTICAEDAADDEDLDIGDDCQAWTLNNAELVNFNTVVDCNNQCVPSIGKDNGTCSDGIETTANFDCVEHGCDGGDCGLQISDGGECIVPTGCADLAYVLGVEVSELKEVGLYGCSVIGDPNISVIGESGCPVYLWNEASAVDNFIYTGETVVDCNSTCTYSIWEGDDSCDDVDMAYGSHLDCVEFDCDGGDCGQVINDGADCFPISDCNELESYLNLNLHQGETVSLLEYEYNSQTICAEDAADDEDLDIGDDCQAWTLNNAELVNFNTVVDCNNQCVPSIGKDNGTCSDGIETTANFDCVEHGCDGFDCSTYPSNDTCVAATSCEHLATYFNLNLTKIGGDGSINCGVIDPAEPKGSTGCQIYVWDNSYSVVEDFLYTGDDTIVDCNHTCVYTVWQGNGNCNEAEADTDIDGNDTGSNFNCPELSCDGGDCGLQISDGGECIVPTGCADLAYLMGVDAGNIQVVGAYGCSVIGDPNFSVIGGPGCLLYSWNEALDNVDNFIYTVETVVDCNSTCTPSSWEGDGSCDDVDMAFGSHLDCVEFDCDGGDCETELPTDGSQDCVPTRESDWIGDNGQYTDPDDDDLF